MKDFGKEVIIDIHQCSADKFTRTGLKEYFDMFQKNGILALRIQEEMKKSGKTLKEFIQ